MRIDPLPYLIRTRDYEAEEYACLGCGIEMLYEVPEEAGAYDRDEPFGAMPLICPGCGHALAWMGILYDAFDLYGYNEGLVDEQLQHTDGEEDESEIPYVRERAAIRLLYRNTPVFGEWNEWEKGFFLSCDDSFLVDHYLTSSYDPSISKRMLIPYPEAFREGKERKEYENFMEENHLYGLGPIWRMTNGSRATRCPFRRCTLISDQVDLEKVRMEEIIRRLDETIHSDRYVLYQVMGESCGKEGKAAFLTEGRVKYDRLGNGRYQLIVLWLQIDGGKRFSLFDVYDAELIQILQAEVEQITGDPVVADTPMIDSIRGRYRGRQEQVQGIAPIGEVEVPSCDGYFESSVMLLNRLLGQVWARENTESYDRI